MPRSRLAAHLLRAAALLLLPMSADACERPSRPSGGSLSPSMVVTMLYHYHFTHGQRWDSTYAATRGLFTPDLASRLDADAKAAAANPNEIVGLDFDPLTDAQDSMTGYALVSAEPHGKTESVVALEIRQDSARVPIRVRLAQTPDGWRVSDLEYRDGTLRSILDQLAADRRREAIQSAATGGEPPRAQ